MTLCQTLTQKLNQLPLSRQLEVLSFVQQLERQQAQAVVRHDPEGLLADQPSGLGLADFVQARRDAWGNFPRELRT